MRALFIIVFTAVVAVGAVTAGSMPASAQTEGAGFCDVFGTLLGEAGQTECENQGGDQIPLGAVTTPTCEAVDGILTQVEDGGGGALAGPIRQIFTDGGICVFAQQEPTTTSTTAGAAPTTAASPGPTLAVTGAPQEAGTRLAVSALVGLVVAVLTLSLRRAAHRSS